MLHYFWIFIAQFGTMVIYAGLIVNLLLHRFRVRRLVDPTSRSSREILRAARYMAFYPAVYIALWLPIAVARMLTYAGREVSPTYLLVAGILISSCGWVDSIVYAVTRKVFEPQRRGTAASNGSTAMDTRRSMRRNSSYLKDSHSTLRSEDIYEAEDVDEESGADEACGRTCNNY